MWVDAGAPSSKRGGWAGLSRRSSGGGEEGLSRGQVPRSWMRPEPGRSAGWLGGRSATRKRRRGGEGQTRVGEAKRAVAATEWHRDGLACKEQNPRPRAVDTKGFLCPMAKRSGVDSSSTGQLAKPSAGRSPPCCPAGATGGVQGAQVPFYQGRKSFLAASQLTSPQATELAQCPWLHPPAFVKEEQGPFARGRGHLPDVALPCRTRNFSLSAWKQGDPATDMSLLRALELAGGAVPGAVEMRVWSSGGRSSEHLSLWDVGGNPVLTGGAPCRWHAPGRQEN